MSAQKPAKGEWVQVWAQVIDDGGHPDDVLVSMESHNEDYRALVRLDHVTEPGKVPTFAIRCSALYECSTDGMYWRCTRHDRHGGMHESNARSLHWDDDTTRGHFEEA